jgi:deazaflavin-dependent oxidoreductase (nitroreductase family)
VLRDLQHELDLGDSLRPLRSLRWRSLALGRASDAEYASQAMATSYRLSTTRRLVNALVRPLVRFGLAGRLTYLLTVEGRRSGRNYSTQVTLVEDGGRRWLVAPYGERNWVKNARAAGWVELSRAGKSERFGVTEVDDAEAGPVLRNYQRRAPVTRTFFDAKASDPVEAFVAEASRHPVFRLGNPVPLG